MSPCTPALDGRSPAARWRSIKPRRVRASPGGGSHAPPRPGRPRAVLGPSGRSRRPTRRATSSIVSKASRAAAGSLSVPQASQAGLDEDHVDRVAGRVVQVAGDAGALLGGRQAGARARRRARRGGRAPRARPFAHGAAACVAGQPCPAPYEHAEDDLGQREAAFMEVRSRSSWAISSNYDERGHEPRAITRLVASDHHPVDRERGAERGPAGSATAARNDARERGENKHRDRRGAARDQRQRGKRHQRTPRGRRSCRRRRSSPACEQPDRRGEDRHGDRGVDRETGASAEVGAGCRGMRPILEREGPAPRRGCNRPGGGTRWSTPGLMQRPSRGAFAVYACRTYLGSA